MTARPAGVEVLLVGDELLTGDVADTNATELARRLTGAGLRPGRITVVGDHVAAIRAAAQDALRRAGAVVMAGGIGPTSDDVTAGALIGLPGRTGEPEPVANPVGTADGLRLQTADGVVYALPGVPRELTAMLDAVLADLIRLAGDRAATLTRILHVALLPEPAVAARLAGLEQALGETGDPVRVGYLAAPGQVRVRLSATAPDPAAARALLDPWLDRAGAALGDVICGIDTEPDVVLHRLLAARGATVSVAESLTGGLVGAALTAMPGSSATFRGGVTAYATELKGGLLGVDPDLLAERGAVDPAVAAQMAAGIRQRLDATYGLAATGVAGPEPQDGHPPGTVHVAVAGPDGTWTGSPQLSGDRERVRALTVAHVLDAARRRIAGLPPYREGQR